MNPSFQHLHCPTWPGGAGGSEEPDRGQRPTLLFDPKSLCGWSRVVGFQERAWGGVPGGVSKSVFARGAHDVLVIMQRGHDQTTHTKRH